MIPREFNGLAGLVICYRRGALNMLGSGPGEKAGFRMSTAAIKRPGPGFALFGLIVGLAAGLAIYGVEEYWIDETSNQRTAYTALFAIAAFAAALLLLAERGARLRAIIPAALIAAILAAPSYFLLQVADKSLNLEPFPAAFWFIAGAPIAGYLMTTFAKAALLDGAPPPYSAVFFHGLTLPLIFAGAAFFAQLAFVLIFSWAALLRAMNVDFFHYLFQEPWFMLPFFGAVGGLSIAMMRGLESVLGALRFLLLLFCRIAMPITAVFSVTFLIVLAIKGADVFFTQPYPGALMLALAFAGMLIFNGVYQNGEGGPPPAWLRLATIVALVAIPVYTGLAAYAFWLRIGEYGLTPARVAGAVMNGLAALYSIVCLAGVVTELNWTGRRWMPLVAPLNTLMIVVWIVVFIAFASPVANPWAISAASQEHRLLSGKVDAAKFDYGYLRFNLGSYGEAALDRLTSLRDHPQAAEIRAGAEMALAAKNRWSYEHDGVAPKPAPLDSSPPPQPGPMDLELNPKDANLGDDGDDAGNEPANEDTPD